MFVSYHGAKAQQLPYTSVLQELHHIYNPAFVAPGTDLEFTGFFRKKWVGFNNAPSTAFVSIQYPFVDMNMSAGAAIVSDQTGPISKFGLELSYNYKLRELFKDDDHLALGIQTFLYQYKFDPTSLKAFQEMDPLLMQMSSTAFNPSVGFGFGYFSYDEEWDDENIFYLGFSIMQFMENELILDNGTSPQERHYFANLGTKIFGYDFMLEPSIQLNYTAPELQDIIFGVKYEMEETFWAGINYSTVNDLSINGGVILNDVGQRYSRLKIGAVAGINAGEIFNAGPGFEFYIGYCIDKD